jgi:2-methylcitrate dehydratase
MWKGAATAFATQNAVFATQLAAAGMSGPQAPITGRHGLVDLVTGPLELPPFGDEYFIPRAKIKYWPVVYNMQALVWAAIELRVRLAGREPASIHAHTSWSAWHESGSEAAKWDPRTRETADHSLPYILAWTLRHGSVGHEAFEPASYLDESLRPVMNRIEVTVDDAITAEFPDTIRMRLVAVDDQGAEHTVEIVNPLGHEANPIARDGIDEKFLRLAEPRLGRGAVEDALEYWWSIEDRGVDAGLDLLRV